MCLQTSCSRIEHKMFAICLCSFTRYPRLRCYSYNPPIWLVFSPLKAKPTSALLVANKTLFHSLYSTEQATEPLTWITNTARQTFRPFQRACFARILPQMKCHQSSNPSLGNSWLPGSAEARCYKTDQTRTPQLVTTCVVPLPQIAHRDTQRDGNGNDPSCAWCGWVFPFR